MKNNILIKTLGAFTLSAILLSLSACVNKSVTVNTGVNSPIKTSINSNSNQGFQVAKPQTKVS